MSTPNASGYGFARDTIPTVASTAARGARFPDPPNGFKVYNQETGAFEQFNGGWATLSAAGAVNASSLVGTVPTANLGAGSAADLFLRGDQTYARPIQYAATPWDFSSADLTSINTSFDVVSDAVEAALQAGVNENVPVAFGNRSTSGSIFRVNRQLVVSGDVLLIDGAGGSTHSVGTRLEWQTGSASWGLKLQSAAGASGNGSCPSGYLRNVTLSNVSGAVPAGSAGLQLRGLRQFEVNGVTSQGFDMGFDLVDNSFGSMFINCRVPVNAGNVGINLRTGPQSGNDIYLLNCWLAGKLCAVSISGGSTNFHFEGGQYSAGQGQTTDQDDYGVFTLGKDYLTGAIAALGNINLNGLDFEDVRRVWMLRSYQGVNPAVTNCTFLANTSSGQPCIGLLKMENASDHKSSYRNNRVTGTFSAATIVSVAGESSTSHLSEDAWQSGSSTTGAGAQGAGWFKSMQEHAAMTRGVAISSAAGLHRVRINGLNLIPDRETTPTEAVLVSGIDCTQGTSFRRTLTAARVIGVPLNPQTGQRITFQFAQDGTGGWNVTWNAVFKGLTFSNTGNTANTRASVSFTYDGTSWNQTGAASPWAA